ncbi:hypothetical protein AB0I30_07300 [Nocardia tengchongensis]|uniref:hypothetical protein n=1 Tax=Nocardia tengchongensis TaxID=2055889 RepID=UPI0033EF0573
MASFVSMQTVGGELVAIKYEAARVHRYGAEKQYSMDIPAYVSFRLGEARVALTVSDARDLLEALPGVLAQHPDAEEPVVGPKAVA